MTGEDDQRERAETAEVRAKVAEARPGWHWWLIMVATSVGCSGVAIYVSTQDRHRSEQAWCEVIGLMAQSAERGLAAAPDNVRARQAVAAVARLRSAYDCP